VKRRTNLIRTIRQSDALYVAWVWRVLAPMPSRTAALRGQAAAICRHLP
jgi:hypothetical protein